MKGEVSSSPRAPEEEIQWILNETQKYLSNELQVRRSDVLSAWRGWRPLASDPHAAPGAPISRDHVISTNPDSGITFIAGGKWTTYREMAEDVVDHIIDFKGLQGSGNSQLRGCATHTKPLWGGEGYSANTHITLVQVFGVSEETARHLARTYGTRAFDVCKMSEPNIGLVWPRFGRPLVSGKNAAFQQVL